MGALTARALGRADKEDDDDDVMLPGLATMRGDDTARGEKQTGKAKLRGSVATMMGGLISLKESSENRTSDGLSRRSRSASTLLGRKNRPATNIASNTLSPGAPQTKYDA